MPDTPIPLDLRSHDLAADKRDELLRLFPEVRTEGGQVDFERLKLALGEMVDTGRERYGLTWPGKTDCFRAIQTPSMGTLRPAPEESVNFDTTENLIIEGDNLEVLKLLQKSYLGRVKMIYIDPPYNTGNDFIYPDNFSESLQTYLQYTGQVDAEGKKFSTNTDTDGRFHSRWLNMMYPRLYLARNLLREDGILFCSIDDTELPRLRHLGDEIFGEENLIAVLAWKKSYGGGAKSKHVVGLHEYVVVYARQKEAIGFLELPHDPAILKYYKYEDEKVALRGPYRTQPLATTSMDDRPNLRFPISWKGEEIWPEKQWQWSSDRVAAAMTANELVIAKRKGKWVVDYKQYLRDENGQERGSKPFSVLDGPYTQAGTKALTDLGLGESGFAFPKPVDLLTQLIQYGEKSSVILDFFAGSGTTAHAVLDLNKQDGGNRKFILVQLPEPTGREDYPTIAEITKERVRRVINKLDAEDEGKLELASGPKPDRGFRVYKLAESNFTTWDANVATPAELASQITAHVHHLRAGRADQDLLAEIILKAGLPLTAPVEVIDVAGLPAHRVNGGELLVCLSRALTLEAVRAMAALAPERVVCLDAGFQDNDQLKANAVQLFKAKNLVFRTA